MWFNLGRMVIQDPITDWKIVVTELVLPDLEHEPLRLFDRHEFKTLADLRAYFLQEKKYSVAKSLGFPVKQEPKPEKYNARLTGRLALWFEDRMIKPTLEFRSVDDFVRFLREHPAVGDVVGYKKKGPGGP
jgi:hypothetical protein